MHNEVQTIPSRLDNIQQLDYPKDRLHVLIVDDGSTDGTPERVAEYLHLNPPEFDTQLIVVPTWSGKPSALNHSWGCCKGEIVVISDADTPLDRSSIRRLVRNFADPTVGGASGRQIVVNSQESPAASMERGYRRVFEILRLGESNMNSTPIFNGAISAFRSHLVERIEPDSQADDIELCAMIREKGYRTVYDPEAIAYVQVPTGILKNIRQKSRRARGIIQSFLRHRGMLFHAKYGRYGLVIFPCEFFMHVMSPFLVLLSLILLVHSMLASPVFLTWLLVGCAIALFMSLILSLTSRVNLITGTAIFLSHQIFLILGLIAVLARKKNYTWETARETSVLQSASHIPKVLQE